MPAVPAKLITPLNAYTHVQTNKVADLEHAVRRYYADVSFDIGRGASGLDAVANRCELNDIALTYGRHGAPLSIGIPNLDAYAMLFAFKGSAGATTDHGEVEIAGDRALVASASEPICLNYNADFEQLILNVKPQALSDKLEALSGETVTDRIVFNPRTDFRRPATEKLRQQFLFIVGQLDSRESNFHPLALAELEQAVIVSFLVANDSNYSVWLRGKIIDAAPWQVRKAEAYIEAHWDQPLTIEALAFVTGINTRTLFHSFQRSRGYSPMEFAKRIRLEQARKMLRTLDQSVTSIAFACGFGNLGHFSGYYRRAFGESPSSTLQRSRSPAHQ